jgi:hypothetical protein
MAFSKMALQIVINGAISDFTLNNGIEFPVKTMADRHFMDSEFHSSMTWIIVFIPLNCS